VTDAGGSEARCPARAPGTQLQRERGRAIVRDAQGAAILVLNDTAAALWELCDGSTSMAEMVLAICDVSSLPPARARADVETTLTHFEEAGLIVVGARMPAPASASADRKPR
jgi:hypothetical protein